MNILDRLSAASKPGETWDVLVLAALEGPEALALYLDSSTEPKRPAPTAATEKAREPLGAYLKSISVEGFRGIGARQTLELPPGPGLTLVVGRNGSGKSSFAEALELLVTGVTYRWENRAKVWREGWRNLHHNPAAIEAEFHVEGEKGTTLAAARWKDDADLADPETFAQIRGKPRMPLAELGWQQALLTYRPFLSYNELGSMLDEGPSKLFDALSAILGLDDLTQAQETLADARKSREKSYKEALQERDRVLALLRPIADERAQKLVAAIDTKTWGLDAAETALAQAQSGSAPDSDVQLLRQLANLQAPEPDAVAKVVLDLREAQKRLTASTGTLAAKSKDLADILDQALRFHTTHGDAPCPVCGKAGALDAKWHDHQSKEVQHLRDVAREATDAQHAADSARQKALSLAIRHPDAAQLVPRHPEGAQRPKDLIVEVTALLDSLTSWNTPLTTSSPLESLASHIESTHPQVLSSILKTRSSAQAELQHREDLWKPVTPILAAWLAQARNAQKSNEAIKPLQAAETWLKQAASEIRNERFAPIKEKAQHIWNQLRLQSNVSLDDIRLTGSATKRQVDLDVTVDGTKGAALGVMSQGEQNALALSLFIPRATLPDSPFRFVVIDDPVQSMDPSRIDGLARVLYETAGKRQVVVFTHDDRLPEAVRRLDIAVTVVEVTRREGSLVELRPGKSPVDRYIEDAMAVAYTDGMPREAARRVIPGFCRLAVEAACMEVVRRRRLSRGERYAEIEELLERSGKLASKVALALFDDPERVKDVYDRLSKEARESADAFRWCNEGTHQEQPGAMVDRIRGTENLARWLRKQA